jgi:CRP-like cAMP-binding protein
VGGSGGVESPSLRHSAWIARCLGRGASSPLAPSDLSAISELLEEHRFAGGQTIFRMGDRPARVRIVRSGSVELARAMHGRRVVLQLLHPGDVFGDIPMLAGMDEPYDARAIEDCVLLTMEASELGELLVRSPRLSQRWMVSVATRMARVQNRLVDLLAGGLREQVASLLLRESEEFGTVRLSQPMIAELVGSRRTSVNRVLKQLESDGIVRLHYRKVEVLDGARLAAATAGSDR